MARGQPKGKWKVHKAKVEKRSFYVRKEKISKNIKLKSQVSNKRAGSIYSGWVAGWKNVKK